MIILTNNQIEIYGPTEEATNKVREKLMDLDLLGDSIFIRPAVAHKTDSDAHKWVCRGWQSNSSGRKGGFDPEIIQEVLNYSITPNN